MAKLTWKIPDRTKESDYVRAGKPDLIIPAFSVMKLIKQWRK